MSNTSLTVVVLVALALGVLALGVGLWNLRSLRGRAARSSPLPTDVEGLRGVVDGLRQEAAGALRHLAVVRYDAFGDMGGRLSWSVALLDADGDGVVLTSIHGRSDARTYAKNVRAWAGEQQLSEEEDEAVKLARAS